ncbi:MAG: hypothetical protein NTX24_00190 [Candidatus Pacearchaeota archaeon]|nr:hypothetical protein [Candidatus Pacearchaeota archaeon]
MVSKKVGLIIVFFLVPILLSMIVNAESCVSLNTLRSDFLPGETMQLEVNIDPSYSSRDLYTSDLFLYKMPGNTAVGANFFLTKVSNTKFFVWFDVPSVAGDYILKIRELCNGNIIISQTDFKIEKPKSIYYDDLKNKVSGKWSTLSLEENIIAAGALYYDDVLRQDAMTAYFYRKDSCVNTNCSSKNAALSIIAFKDFATRAQMKNLLDAFQNNLRGTWDLEIVAGEAQDCNLSVGYNNTKQINLAPTANKFSLDFSNITNSTNETQITISDNCNAISRKVIFTYKNVTKNFSVSNSFTLESPGCFGNGLKSACDPESTAYALYAMKTAGFGINDEEKAVSWLKDNVNSIDQFAILYFLEKDPAMLTQVLASQNYNGAWQKNGINDVRTTAFVYYILLLSDNKTSEILSAMDKASSYLSLSLDNPALGIAEMSYALFFVFPNLEPLMSVWPGIVKTKSGEKFNLILNNNGNEDISAYITLFNGSITSTVTKKGMQNLQISVPYVYTSDARVLTESAIIQYSNKVTNSITKTYSIPIILFTLQGIEGTNGTFIINQSQINQSQQQNIINQTLNNTSMNQTTNISGSLIAQNFYFSETNITKNMTTSEFSFTLRLINRLNSTIRDIDVSASTNFVMGLQIEPQILGEIGSNEQKIVTVFVDPTAFSSQRSTGSITATGTYGTNQIVNTTVNIIFVKSSQESTIKSCGEMNGTKCGTNQDCVNKSVTWTSDVNECCLTSCVNKPTSSNKTLSIILIVVVVVILVVVLIFLRKKPQKSMKEFSDELDKQQQPGTGDFKSKEFRDEFGAGIGKEV